MNESKDEARVLITQVKPEIDLQKLFIEIKTDLHPYLKDWSEEKHQQGLKFIEENIVLKFQSVEERDKIYERYYELYDQKIPISSINDIKAIKSILMNTKYDSTRKLWKNYYATKQLSMFFGSFTDIDKVKDPKAICRLCSYCLGSFVRCLDNKDISEYEFKVCSKVDDNF